MQQSPCGCSIEPSYKPGDGCSCQSGSAFETSKEVGAPDIQRRIYTYGSLLPQVSFMQSHGFPLRRKSIGELNTGFATTSANGNGENGESNAGDEPGPLSGLEDLEFPKNEVPPQGGTEEGGSHWDPHCGRYIGGGPTYEPPPPPPPPPPKKKCCCAVDVSLKDQTPVTREGFFVHSIDADFHTKWEDWNKDNDLECDIEWWEWNTKADPKQKQGPPNTWTDQAAGPLKKMIDDWKNTEEWRVPGSKHPKTLHDLTGTNVRPGKTWNRTIHFAVVLLSAKECPCSIKSVTAYGTAIMVMNDGVGDTDKTKFKQGGIPDKHGEHEVGFPPKDANRWGMADPPWGPDSWPREDVTGKTVFDHRYGKR